MTAVRPLADATADVPDTYQHDLVSRIKPPSRRRRPVTRPRRPRHRHRSDALRRERDHAAVQPEGRVRRPREPRPAGGQRHQAPDQTGPHHRHLPGRRADGQRRGQCLHPRVRRPCPRPGLLHRDQPRPLQRQRFASAAVGRGVPAQVLHRPVRTDLRTAHRGREADGPHRGASARHRAQRPPPRQVAGHLRRAPRLLEQPAGRTADRRAGAPGTTQSRRPLVPRVPRRRRGHRRPQDPRRFPHLRHQRRPPPRSSAR